MNDIQSTGAPKNNIKKLSAFAAIVLLVTVAVLTVLGWRAGLFTSAETLQAFLMRMGVWAPTVFLLLQILQVVIAFIPGGVTCAVGVVAFGPVYGFLLNYTGILVGSFAAFLFARRFGLPLIRQLVPEKAFARYVGWLEREQRHFNRLFAFAVFLPFLPDDMLCMMAGASAMKARTFWWILLLCKIPFLLPYSVALPLIVSRFWA